MRDVPFHSKSIYNDMVMLLDTNEWDDDEISINLALKNLDSFSEIESYFLIGLCYKGLQCYGDIGCDYSIEDYIQGIDKTDISSLKIIGVDLL